MVAIFAVRLVIGVISHDAVIATLASSKTKTAKKITQSTQS